MYFSFIDESGKPNPKDNDIRPILNAVCVKDSDIKIITQKLHTAELECFGEAAGEKRQLKGNKMINKRCMKPEFKNRKDYVEKIIDIMVNHDLCVFAVVMERPDFKPYVRKGLLPVQYRYLLERLNTFGASKQTQCLLVYDKIDDKEDGFIADGVKNFLFTHGFGRKFENMVHMPLFVSSINNPLIRFPDLTGNILRVFYGLDLDKRKPGNDHEVWITNLANQIKSKSINLKNHRGSFDYGIYFMKKCLFPRNHEELSQEEEACVVKKVI